MIEGLHYDFPADELRAHCLAREAYHRQRAAAYRESLTKLAGSEDDVVAPGMSTSGRSDLQSRAKGHDAKAALFALRESHIVIGETYRLEERDLAAIELTDHHY